MTRVRGGGTRGSTPVTYGVGRDETDPTTRSHHANLSQQPFYTRPASKMIFSTTTTLTVHKSIDERTEGENREMMSRILGSLTILYRLKKHPLCRKQFTRGGKEGWGEETRERDMAFGN